MQIRNSSLSFLVVMTIVETQSEGSLTSAMTPMEIMRLGSVWILSRMPWGGAVKCANYWGDCMIHSDLVYRRQFAKFVIEQVFVIG